MSIADIDSLATALEAGLLPAEVAFASFAENLMSNANTIFLNAHLAPGQLLWHVQPTHTGLQAGLGLDTPPGFTAPIALAINELAKWIRTTSLEATDGADNNTLDHILRNDAHKAEQMRENLTTRLLAILLGSKADLGRNAHSETREPAFTVTVDWASAIQPGKHRDFLASVVRTIYFNGNASAASRLLHAVFGHGYVGDPNSINLAKGSKTGQWGAVPNFLFGASPAAAAASLRKWEAMANMGLNPEEQQQVFACSQVFGLVNSTPSKCGHEQAYATALGDGYASDAFIMKVYTTGAHHAAANASQDGEHAKAAKIVSMYLHLVDQDEGRHKSHVFFNTAATAEPAASVAATALAHTASKPRTGFLLLLLLLLASP